jgi:hypothetical protein
VGAKIIFTHRKFCWLFTIYSVALYLHRHPESSVGSAFVRRVLKTLRPWYWIKKTDLDGLCNVHEADDADDNASVLAWLEQ